MTSTAWENFDRWCDAAVRREVNFARFVKEADADFGRLARIAARGKHPPAWMGVDDVKSQLIALSWHYLFERPNRKTGAVGFDPSCYNSAGAYCRWKIRMKMKKVLSRAKGEHQHRRMGPGAPEYLSKTGELPEQSTIVGVDEIAERAIEIRRMKPALERLCKTAREFAIVNAIAQGLGDGRRTVAYLMENGFACEREAWAAVDEVADRLARKVAKNHARAA